MNFALSPCDLLFDEGPLTVVETLAEERIGDAAVRVASCIQSRINPQI